jgi:replicative DNA helicase
MKKIGSYGIQYLDDKLRGIMDDEFVIIGLATGSGKTTISQIIARTNALKGVKTALFALESFQGETIEKEAWVYWKQVSKNFKITFREWEISVSESEKQRAREEAQKKFNNVKIIERTNAGYTLDMLEEDFKKAVEEGCQLIILDHVDYFSNVEDLNDLKFTKKVMDKVRGLQDTYKIPIVAFSQFRKSNDKGILIPALEELFGSSEKSKTATTVIIGARDYETNSCAGRYPTFLAIRKDRYGETSACRTAFDSRLNCYEACYEPIRVNYWGNQITELGEEE